MSPRRHGRVAVTFLGLLALFIPAAAGAAAPAAKHPYPVTWDFLVNAFAGSQSGPNDPPPGSNLPCHPSSAHPRPVVLVHGLAADQSDNWGAIAPFLANHGYCVFSLTYGNDPSAPGFLNRIGGRTDMAQSARVLARFVRHVRQVTGAAKVDLVGHSEGGTMPDWYLKFDNGYRYVDNFVALAGVLHGTTFWGMGNLYALAQKFGYAGSSNALFGSWCTSCLEFLPSSPWMQKLDEVHAAATTHEAATCPADGAAVDGVKYTSIATNDDELVRPPTSDFIKPSCADDRTRISTANILIQRQCAQDQSDHLSIAADPNVAQDILNALDPEHAQRVRCQPVLPSIG
ncbi:MAG: esterase/lipase family protein [Mycobacteriales bacterium]